MTKAATEQMNDLNRAHRGLGNFITPAGVVELTSRHLYPANLPICGFEIVDEITREK